jgi:hypothetical protein
MVEIDILRTVAAVLFLFFVPGFFLWKALVPRAKDVADEFAAVYTVAFSMALSIAAVILVGIVLGALPPDPVTGKGHIVDYNLPSLVALSAAAALVAWYRGAFPQMGRLSPTLKRNPKPAPDGSGVSDDPKRYWREQDLMARRLEVRAEIKRRERGKSSMDKDKVYNSKRKAQLTEELVKVDEDLQKLRDERDRAIEKAEEEVVRLEERRRKRRDAVLTALRLRRPPEGQSAPGGSK